jgi:hypothetical protein
MLNIPNAPIVPIAVPPVFKAIDPTNPNTQILAVARLNSKDPQHILVLRYAPDEEAFAVVSSHPKGCDYKAYYHKSQEKEAKEDFTAHLEAELIERKKMEAISEPTKTRTTLNDLSIEELEKEMLRLEGELEQAKEAHDDGEVEDVEDNNNYILNITARIERLNEALQKKLRRLEKEGKTISVDSEEQADASHKAPNKDAKDKAPEEPEDETPPVDF